MSKDIAITLDGSTLAGRSDETIMEVAARNGVYIPHLCHHPDYSANGSCKLCTVRINGRYVSACTTPVQQGMEVESDSDELRQLREDLTELLFVEGNHYCPGCERSGNCQLQALGYASGMQDRRFYHLYPKRKLDASHPQVVLDRDRCILCGLCVRASIEDGKQVFSIGGRGAGSALVVNSASGLLGDSDLSQSDRAAQVCPVGAILVRGEGFSIPIGERLYDHDELSEVGNRRPEYPLQQPSVTKPRTTSSSGNDNEA